MKIDIAHSLYVAGMILLAFVTALMVTKTIGRYIDKKKKDEDVS